MVRNGRAASRRAVHEKTAKNLLRIGRQLALRTQQRSVASRMVLDYLGAARRAAGGSRTPPRHRATAPAMHARRQQDNSPAATRPAAGGGSAAPGGGGLRPASVLVSSEHMQFALHARRLVVQPTLFQ